MRGDNLKAGQKDGDAGRRLGSSLGGKAAMSRPAPEDCPHCRAMHYVTMAQHLGHIGFAAVMENKPEALHSLRPKIRKTGLPESRARWKALGR